MKLSFYPGCSLEGMAVDYARSIDAVFQALDIDLIEIDDWSCCGATAAHSLSKAMSVIYRQGICMLRSKWGLILYPVVPTVSIVSGFPSR